MKTTLPKRIESLDQAKTFLQELINNNEHYHPEDDAHDIEWSGAEPSDQEKDQLNQLMDDVYNFADANFDPCGFILDNDPAIQEQRLEDKIEALTELGCRVEGENIHFYRETIANKENLRTMTWEAWESMIEELKEFKRQQPK